MSNIPNWNSTELWIENEINKKRKRKKNGCRRVRCIVAAADECCFSISTTTLLNTIQHYCTWYMCSVHLWFFFSPAKCLCVLCIYSTHADSRTPSHRRNGRHCGRHHLRLHTISRFSASFFRFIARNSVAPLGVSVSVAIAVRQITAIVCCTLVVAHDEYVWADNRREENEWTYDGT